MNLPPELGSLLARWHHWRSRYSAERSYARTRFMDTSSALDDDECESMTMRALEEEIERLPADMRLALQHVARTECLGVEVVMMNRLPHDKAARESLCERAIQTLASRARGSGLL